MTCRLLAIWAGEESITGSTGTDLIGQVLAVALKASDQIWRQGDESRLAKLAVADGDDALAQIHVLVTQANRLSLAQTGQKQHPKRCAVNQPTSISDSVR